LASHAPHSESSTSIPKATPLIAQEGLRPSELLLLASGLMRQGNLRPEMAAWVEYPPDNALVDQLVHAQIR
jgi:hypothetical protein